MIDDILSDYEKHWKAHRFDRVAEPLAEKPSEPRSVETILAKKYNDAYRAAKATLDYASAFKIIGVVLATLIIVGTVLRARTPDPRTRNLLSTRCPRQVASSL